MSMLSDLASLYVLQPGAVAANANRLSLKKNKTDTACVFLQGNKCAVYDNRPTQVSTVHCMLQASGLRLNAKPVVGMSRCRASDSIETCCSAVPILSGQSL